MSRQGLYLGLVDLSYQRQISRPSPPPSPILWVSVFLDTAAQGAAGALKQALLSQTCSLVLGKQSLAAAALTIHKATFGLTWPILMALGALAHWTASSSPSHTYHSG